MFARIPTPEKLSWSVHAFDETVALIQAPQIRGVHKRTALETAQDTIIAVVHQLSKPYSYRYFIFGKRH